MIAEFTVPGHPVSWKRARARGKLRFVDPKLRAYQMTLATFASIALPKGWPRAGVYSVEIEARVRGPLADVDNLAKTVLDALEGIAWDNDRSVEELYVIRASADGVGDERISVAIHAGEA